MSDPATALDKRDLEHLAAEIREAGECCVQSLSSASQAFLAWALWEAFRKPWVWVVDGPKSLEALYQDMLSLAAGREGHLAWFPAWESLPGQARAPHPDVTGARLRCLMTCTQPPGPDIVLTCVQAVMQRTLSPPYLARNTYALALAQEQQLDALVTGLQDGGYHFVPEVEARGEASLRGGLLDVWPYTEPWPLRVEFFGDVIDSIRTFDPCEQTSVERLASVSIPPADEWGAIENVKRAPDLTAFLPPETAWVWSEPERLREHAKIYREAVEEANAEAFTLRFASVRTRVRRTFKGGALSLRSSEDGAPANHVLPLAASVGLPAVTGSVLHPDVMESARRDLIRDLGRRAAGGDEVHLFFDTSGACDRFIQMYPEASSGCGLHLHIGPLSQGFIYDSRGLVVVAESDLYGYRKERPRRADLAARRPAPGHMAGPPLAAWTDMQPGELVVHVDHGVGKYLGLYEIEFHGRLQEVLAIEYAGQARLYVPVSQTHLLSRYVGVGRARPDLHALGGRQWLRHKAAAERAIHDLAASLIETQAAREALDGHAFPHDTNWQHEFETAFPYAETDDQARAVEEVKRDMESRRPMDRLICGDVGYGKTEVAMRAAFKAVMDGKQVAVLVPTTVLAQQHYYTFGRRMSAFPVTIEMLSRFRTRAQQERIVRGLREGSVDIVIGTHRLIQPDVAFKDLGLVIIDEEQRFGVAHKERLKQLRQLVDILTLTATPIPRTLYLSLTGARDMSTIQTPPRERLPVETIVTQPDDDTIRQAVLRELNREGQVFFLHNRVHTIHRVETRLKKLVPEARIGVAHGQMSERVLASVMRRFVAGELDVLLCTTIIESGVDIPNVNTIFIDRADRFGVADLYQLRGRVGRYKHQAYAYLLLPRHVRLFASARKRIHAIKKHSSLGAGFKLALRDLEIRGAGNLLGIQQSGHIAAVGFDLYCQLLRRTVARMKGEPLPPIIDVEVKLDFIDLSPRHADSNTAAAVPYSYMEDENQRLDTHRKIAGATSEEGIDALYAELRDRFGPIPGPLDRLLNVARLRIVAAEHRIQTVEVREGKIMLTRDNDYLMRNRRFPRLTSKTASDQLDEIIDVIKGWDRLAPRHQRQRMGISSR